MEEENTCGSITPEGFLCWEYCQKWAHTYARSKFHPHSNHKVGLASLSLDVHLYKMGIYDLDVHVLDAQSQAWWCEFILGEGNASLGEVVPMSAGGYERARNLGFICLPVQDMALAAMRPSPETKPMRPPDPEFSGSKTVIPFLGKLPSLKCFITATGNGLLQGINH